MIGFSFYKHRDYISAIITLLLVACVFVAIPESKPLASDVVKKDKIVKLSIIAPEPTPPKPTPPKPAPPKPAPPKPAPPKPKVLEAPVPTALQADPSLEAKYLKKILIQVTKNKHYPARAESFGITGDVVVEYVLDRTGVVLSVLIRKSSGNKMLDKAALKAVQTAHFEAWPTRVWVGQVSKRLSVKIEYQIKG